MFTKESLSARARSPGPAIGIRALANAVGNGDFAIGLVNWSTTGDVTSASGEAIVGDNAATGSILYQPVALAPGDYVLEFDFGSALSSNVDQGTFLDTFFASLYFVTDPQALDIPAGSFAASTSLMDLDAMGVFNSAGTVSPSPVDPTLQRFAVGFAATHAYVVPAFEVADLNGEAGDSAVRIDNVHITVVPEPSTWALLTLGAAAGLRFGRRRP